MQRIYPLAVPFLLLAFLLQACSTVDIAGKRHYGNRMYVKVDKQKDNGPAKVGNVTHARSNDGIALLPERRSANPQHTNETSPLRKLEQRVAKALPRVNNAPRHATKSYAASTQNDAPAVRMVQTVNRNTSEVTQEIDDDITNILVILGVILIIIGVISLILEVATFGWLGLIIAGLLIVLLAYLLF